MFYFIATILLSLNAHAVIMEPTFQAAEALGYQIVGEVEFHKESFRPSGAEMAKQIKEVGEICPRTQAYDPDISSFARFVIIAWSDHDYPARARQFHSAHQQLLAQQRAESVAIKVRRAVKGNLNFELVNMAHRKPHLVQAGEGQNISRSRTDIKKILESAGAAPSDPLGYGLFAEYSQAAKAVIWVECKESLVRRRGPAPPTVQLAHVGRNL